ncbi:MAG TPA: hypothetical protein V6D17_12285 [Candidatus Obscuribacterales bacterium]
MPSKIKVNSKDEMHDTSKIGTPRSDFPLKSAVFVVTLIAILIALVLGIFVAMGIQNAQEDSNSVRHDLVPRGPLPH